MCEPVPELDLCRHPSFQPAYSPRLTIMADVTSMNSYAVVCGRWEKGTKSKEIVVDKPGSLNWQDLEEADEPMRALYSWAVETSRSFFLDDYVYAYEGLRFIVQDHAFLEGETRVLVDDIDYYEQKLVLFRRRASTG